MRAPRHMLPGGLGHNSRRLPPPRSRPRLAVLLAPSSLHIAPAFESLRRQSSLPAYYDAPGRTRTSNPFQERDSKSRVSSSCTTGAYGEGVHLLASLKRPAKRASLPRHTMCTFRIAAMRAHCCAGFRHGGVTGNILAKIN